MIINFLGSTTSRGSSFVFVFLRLAIERWKAVDHSSEVDVD